MYCPRNQDRGVDFRYNKDLEDIIYLTCVRNNFSETINTNNSELRQFFKLEFEWILSDPLYIREAIQVLLPSVFETSYADI